MKKKITRSRAEIYRLWTQGWTCSRLADLEGVSYQRMWQVLNDLGVKRSKRPKGAKLQVWLDEGLKEKIQQAAAAEGLTMGSFVRRSMRAACGLPPVPALLNYRPPTAGK